MRAVPANRASEKGQKPNLVLLPPLQLQLSPIVVVACCLLLALLCVVVLGVGFWVVVM